ncbi:mCG61979, isoform CRA_a, partial [Mus musculus]
ISQTEDDSRHGLPWTCMPSQVYLHPHHAYKCAYTHADHTHTHTQGRKMFIMVDVMLPEFDYYEKESKCVRPSQSSTQPPSPFKPLR